MHRYRPGHLRLLVAAERVLRWLWREGGVFWRDLNRPDRGFRRSLTLSAVVHGVVLIVFTLSPSCHSRAVGQEPRPIVFEYLPLDEPLDQPVAPKPKPKPKPKEVPAPETKMPAEAKLPEEKPKPKPPETPPPEQPDPEPKAEETVPAPDSLARPPQTQQPVELARIDEPQFAYDYYLQTVVGKVSEVWEPPAGLAASGAATEATLVFRISSQGRVLRTEVEVPSLAGFFDRSAAEAILRAQPYPPFPPAYGGRWLTVHLRFRFDP
ncbi:MAG: TonB C-terminal domain-containing protein [Candidatus Eisenbacteria sp.]|nr:TonB C-terminal domain-containing protein [Candidatus Eisenbacteria bacterium]